MPNQPTASAKLRSLADLAPAKATILNNLETYGLGLNSTT